MIRNIAQAFVALVLLLSMYAAVQDAAETHGAEWGQHETQAP